MKKIYFVILSVLGLFLYQENSGKIIAGELNRDNYFENEFVKITVNSISKSKNERIVFLSMQVMNKTKNDLYIAFAKTRSGVPTIFSNDGRTAMGRARGIPIQSSHDKHDKSAYTKISAKNRTLVNLTFSFSSEMEADNFSFTSEMRIYNEKNPNKPIRFSAGIAKIVLK